MADDRAETGPTLLVVAGAMVDSAGRVLVQQRPTEGDHASLWEIPGGKVEPREDVRAALVRELTEELGIRVDAAALETLGFATGRTGTRELVLLLFGSRDWDGEPRALHAAAIRWVEADELATLAMPLVDVALLPMIVAFVQSPQMARRGESGHLA